MQVQYGIIGNPLAHTFSPSYFARKFENENINARFETYPLEKIEDFPKLLHANPGLKGLSVTIPYKEQIFGYLDEIDTTAQEVGAVNCVRVRRGYTKGYNTDITGFEKSLVPLLQPQHKRALILGTGGASKAVAWVLANLGISYLKVSRSKRSSDIGTIGYEDLTKDMLESHCLIVNATPVGMYPNIDAMPALGYTSISNQHILYDLIYNPELTQFLAQGKAKGATVRNGLEMLEIQAEASWEIWNFP